MFYLLVGVAGIFLAIIAAANMYWGYKADTKMKKAWRWSKKKKIRLLKELFLKQTQSVYPLK